jgi:DNA repair protein RadC
MKQVFIIHEPIGNIKNSKELFEKIKIINIDYTQENFLVFYLNTKNKIIDSEILFKGGLDCCVVDPKTIFRKALMHNAKNIIIAHNHPSEDLKPSCEDKEIYNRLKEAGEMLALNVLDSIVFNEKEFYSMEGYPNDI